jgi:hypothetical protein
MTSLIHKKLGHGLMLISAVFLLHANNALAAEFDADAQTQAKDLLTGTVDGGAKFIDSHAIPSNSESTSRLDPQEQARQLILGKPNVDAASGRAVDRRSDDDPQESARRMILGREAGSTAAPALKRSVSLTHSNEAR